MNYINKYLIIFLLIYELMAYQNLNIITTIKNFVKRVIIIINYTIIRVTKIDMNQSFYILMIMNPTKNMIISIIYYLEIKALQTLHIM